MNSLAESRKEASTVVTAATQASVKADFIILLFNKL
jgi:hypothetical protein